MNIKERVAIIGAGTMGRGIAQVSACSGHSVALYDVHKPTLDEAVLAIAQRLQKGIDKGKLTPTLREQALGNLHPTTELDEAVRRATLVVEAVPEHIDLKRQVFAAVDACLTQDTILASNTSSLSVTELAAACQHPQRVVGAHFFNPPDVLTLLEIVRAEQTSDETVTRLRAWGDTLGREVIVIHDCAGFATTRLGLVQGLEAMRMLQEGVASAADIDRAMVHGYRHPMGPLRLSDLVGLDVRLASAEYLHRELGERFRPPQILRRLVRAGRLGKKSGLGFYPW